MCQMNVMLEHDGQQETILENASVLEVIDDGVTVSALFEEPKTVKGARVKKIDFMSGTVTLSQD